MSVETAQNCTCGVRFLDAEDFRDHLPCPGTAAQQWERQALAAEKKLAQRDAENATLRAVCETVVACAEDGALGPAFISCEEDCSCVVCHARAALVRVEPSRVGMVLSPALAQTLHWLTQRSAHWHTTRDVAAALGINPANASSRLRSLFGMGRVERRGHGRHCHSPHRWRVRHV